MPKIPFFQSSAATILQCHPLASVPSLLNLESKWVSALNPTRDENHSIGSHFTAPDL